jgi:hypothetical protein
VAGAEGWECRKGGAAWGKQGVAWAKRGAEWEVAQTEGWDCWAPLAAAWPLAAWGEGEEGEEGGLQVKQGSGWLPLPRLGVATDPSDWPGVDASRAAAAAAGAL